MKKRISYQPDYIVTPGETITETITFLQMTLTNFAEHMSITEQSLIEIINSTQIISNEIAVKLEKTTGTPANFWISLDRNYSQSKFYCPSFQ